MAWSHLQSTTKNETSNNSALAFAGACTSGSYLFLAVRYGTTGQTGTASDPTNGSWTRHLAYDSNTESFAIFGVNNTGTTALSVTLTNTTSTTRRWAILEYQDGSNTLALDLADTSSATGNSTTLLSGALTPTQSNDLCFCAGIVSGAQTFTAVGLTKRQEVVQKIAVGDKVIADTSSTTGSYTIGGADPWACAIVLIKSTAAVGGTTDTLVKRLRFIKPRQRGKVRRIA